MGSSSSKNPEEDAAKKEKIRFQNFLTHVQTNAWKIDANLEHIKKSVYFPDIYQLDTDIAYCQPCRQFISSHVYDQSGVLGQHLYQHQKPAKLIRIATNSWKCSECSVCLAVSPFDAKNFTLNDRLALHVGSNLHDDKIFQWNDSEFCLLTSLATSEVLTDMCQSDENICDLCVKTVGEDETFQNHIRSFSHLILLKRLIEICFNVEIKKLRKERHLTRLYEILGKHRSVNEKRLPDLRDIFTTEEVSKLQRQFSMKSSSRRSSVSSSIGGRTFVKQDKTDNALIIDVETELKEFVDDVTEPKSSDDVTGSKKFVDVGTDVAQDPKTFIDAGTDVKPDSKTFNDVSTATDAKKFVDTGTEVDKVAPDPKTFLDAETEVKPTATGSKKLVGVGTDVPKNQGAITFTNSKEEEKIDFRPKSPETNAVNLEKSNKNPSLPKKGKTIKTTEINVYDEVKANSKVQSDVKSTDTPAQELETLAKDLEKLPKQSQLQCIVDLLCKMLPETSLDEKSTGDVRTLLVSLTDPTLLLKLQAQTKETQLGFALGHLTKMLDTVTVEESRKVTSVGDFLKSIQLSEWKKLHEPHESTICRLISPEKIKLIWENLKTKPNNPVQKGDEEIVDIITDYHAYCLGCRFHFYSQENPADLPSFFSRHINTPEHLALSLLLHKDKDMFVIEDPNKGLWRCNACKKDLKFLGKKPEILETELADHLLSSNHSHNRKLMTNPLHSLLVSISTQQDFRKMLKRADTHLVCCLCRVPFIYWEELGHLESPQHLDFLAHFLEEVTDLKPVDFIGNEVAQKKLWDHIQSGVIHEAIKILENTAVKKIVTDWKEMDEVEILPTAISLVESNPPKEKSSTVKVVSTTQPPNGAKLVPTNRPAASEKLIKFETSGNKKPTTLSSDNGIKPFKTNTPILNAPPVISNGTLKNTGSGAPGSSGPKLLKNLGEVAIYSPVKTPKLFEALPCQMVQRCKVHFSDSFKKDYIEVVNGYHAYCKCCNRHIYSQTNSKDQYSPFSNHFNSVDHIAKAVNFNKKKDIMNDTHASLEYDDETFCVPCNKVIRSAPLAIKAKNRGSLMLCIEDHIQSRQHIQCMTSSL